MILQQLYKDAPAILGKGLPPSLYSVKKVGWVVRLDGDGSLAGIVSLESERTVPHVTRSSGIRPLLLADTPPYTLGVLLDPQKEIDTRKHSAYKDLVARCAEETGNVAVAAVANFLNKWQPEKASLPEKMGASDIVIFEVEGQWPVEAEDVQQFWARMAKAQGENKKTERRFECLVTGKLGDVETSLPEKIKGIPGGQSSGTALVSVNSDAFESYGLDAGYTSPISREAAERFTKALNHLISDSRARLYIGGTVYVFWTASGPEEDIALLLNRPDPQQVQALLNSVRTGKRVLGVREEEFYALALTASGGRAVVREWISSTLPDAKERLGAWFAAHSIVSHDGSETRYLGVRELAVSLYRYKRGKPDWDAIEPRNPRALIAAALHGAAVPPALRDLAVMRCRGEQRVTTARAALIKAALATDPRNPAREEFSRTMTGLNPNNHDAAYLCGRLLCELERIQRRALGKINTTLTDRFYGAASSTPAAVFGTLLTDAKKAHLPKIRKKNEATYNALQESIAGILAPMGEWPRTLTLERQALFALGYYHQLADNIDRARDHAAGAPDDLTDAMEDDDNA